MATTTKKRKSPVSGKQAVTAEVRYEVTVDCKSRYYERGYPEQNGKPEPAALHFEQVGDEIRVREDICGEVQFILPMSTLRALMVELEKEVKVS